MSKQIKGTVVSNAMQKTVVVEVVAKYRHPLYRKVVTKHKKFKARNEIEGVVVGDVVVIEETRPISKETHHQVIEKVEGKTK